MASASASVSCLSWPNRTLAPPSLPPRPLRSLEPISFTASSRLSPTPAHAISTVSDVLLTHASTTPTSNSWSEFAGNVSGEWDGFAADFSSQGLPLELPESVVPEAFREWEVKVFDWQTQCPTLAQPRTPSLLYKSIKLLPTVGCEADAATRYSIDQRIIGAAHDNKASAFAYSATGSYVAVWPQGNSLLEVEHCLINPKDKELRVRIYQVLRLAETKMLLHSISVFCEQWYGPFRNGDQLGGCAVRDSGFASTPTTTASGVVGAWRRLHAAARFNASDSVCIRQVTDERAFESVREESDLILLPKGLWCSLRESEDGETTTEAGWLFEQLHAITSRCIFSGDFRLKEISIGKETAEPDI